MKFQVYYFGTQIFKMLSGLTTTKKKLNLKWKEREVSEPYSIFTYKTSRIVYKNMCLWADISYAGF